MHAQAAREQHAAASCTTAPRAVWRTPWHPAPWTPRANCGGASASVAAFVATGETVIVPRS